jgi:hypothetical protein
LAAEQVCLLFDAAGTAAIEPTKPQQGMSEMATPTLRLLQHRLVIAYRWNVGFRCFPKPTGYGPCAIEKMNAN